MSDATPAAATSTPAAAASSSSMTDVAAPSTAVAGQKRKLDDDTNGTENDGTDAKKPKVSVPASPAKTPSTTVGVPPKPGVATSVLPKLIPKKIGAPGTTIIQAPKPLSTTKPTPLGAKPGVKPGTTATPTKPASSNGTSKPTSTAKPAPPKKKASKDSDSDSSSDSSSSSEDSDDEPLIDTKKKTPVKKAPAAASSTAAATSASTESATKKAPARKASEPKKKVESSSDSSDSDSSDSDSDSDSSDSSDSDSSEDSSDSDSDAPKRKRAPAKKKAAAPRKSGGGGGSQSKYKGGAKTKRPKGEGEESGSESSEDEGVDESKIILYPMDKFTVRSDVVPLKETQGANKWWNRLRAPGDKTKWTTLEHNGILFPAEYVPHKLPLNYDGEDIVLNPEAEEVASMWATMLETAVDFTRNPTFAKNFFRDFKALLPKDSPIKDLTKCNFDRMRQHLKQERETAKLIKNSDKEAKAREKKEKDVSNKKIDTHHCGK